MSRGIVLRGTDDVLVVRTGVPKEPRGRKRTIFIPTIGTLLTLAAPWTFRVIQEYRNQSLLAMLREKDIDVDGLLAENVTEPGKILLAQRYVDATLPTGTELRVDRIYIKKGLSDFDSLTFWLKGATAEKRRPQWRHVPIEHPVTDAWGRVRNTEMVQTEDKVSRQAVRFFAKLDDVNHMVIK